MRFGGIVHGVGERSDVTAALPLALGRQRLGAAMRSRTASRVHGRPIAALLCAVAACVGSAEEVRSQAAGVYVGDTVAGVRHGLGTLTWGDGYRYEGEFRDGRMHGPGVLLSPSGEIYEGAFQDGVRQGEGELRQPSGDVYRGEFHNDLMSGKGTLTWRTGDVYEGDFVAGERTGHGVYQWQNGDRYEGDFVAGEPHGHGAYRYADGRVYTGDFVDGQRQGFGELAWRNGNRYRGGFSADRRHGVGHLAWRDGTHYRGWFAFDRQDGPGVKDPPEGERLFQIWDDGELVSAHSVAAVARCALRIDEEPWMYEGDECINGLAHGDGRAVRLDGLAYVLDGRFVLGRLVRGEVHSLVVAAPP